MLNRCNRILVSDPKGTKKNRIMQGQNRRKRKFCFSRNFFCFRCKSTRLTIRKFTHFKHQFTHFKHRKPTMKWQKSVAYCTTSYERQSYLITLFLHFSCIVEYCPFVSKLKINTEKLGRLRYLNYLCTKLINQ